MLIPKNGGLSIGRSLASGLRDKTHSICNSTLARSTQRFVSGNICSESLKSPETLNWQHKQFSLYIKANCYQLLLTCTVTSIFYMRLVTREAIHWMLTTLLCCREIGDFAGFAGTLHQIWTTAVGKMQGLRFMVPQLSGKMWGLTTLLLAKREEIGSKLCHVFSRLMKRLRGRTRGCVLKSIGHFLLCMK